MPLIYTFLLLKVIAVEYCRYEEGDEIHYFASDTFCNFPAITSSQYLSNLSNYSRVVIDVQSSSFVFLFGESITKPFVANELFINNEVSSGQVESMYFIFRYFKNDVPLTINSSYDTNKFHFDFSTGSSPTRIYGNVGGFNVRFDDHYQTYNLPRQRTFFGTVTKLTNYAHIKFLTPLEYGLYYGISFFGEKFPTFTTSGSSFSVFKLACGGMNRYYLLREYTQILSTSITCTKTFSENDDDDFDSFIVTVKMFLHRITPSNFRKLLLFSSNMVVERIENEDSQFIYTYPNMFYKYNSTNNTNIYIFGTTERKDLITVSFKVIENTEASATSIMEVQTKNKTLSTYIISSSKQINGLVFLNFTETKTIQSQIMLIGMGGIYSKPNSIDATGSCELMIIKLSYNRCYKCKSGYGIVNGNCSIALTLAENCLVLSNSTHCSLCQEGYYLDKGICELKDVNCLKYGNGVCMKCQFGYQLINNKCEKGYYGHCYYEGDQCIECSDNYTLNGNNSCIWKENKNGINEIIYCQDGYYIENGICNECIDSSYCESKTKISCLEGCYNDNNTCISKTCETKDSNGKCGIEIDKCQDNLIVNGRCVECENGSYPNINGECITTEIEHCIDQNSFGCKRCSDGYYLDSNLQCQICSNECVTCIKSSDHCLSCENGNYLSNHTCLSLEGMNETCKKVLPDGSGCAICKEGYFKQEKGCNKCQVKCKSCNRNTTCLECNRDYFRDNENDCISKSVIFGCEVEITEDGCSQCQDGFYKYKSNQCKECSVDCSECLNKNECFSCKSGFILTNNTCVSYNQMDYCIEARHSKCSKCLIFFAPSSDGTSCSIHIAWWMIVIVALICVAIFFLFVMIVYYIIKSCSKRNQKKKMRKNVTIFKLKKSSMSFIDLGDNIVVNTNEILFNEGKQLPVNNEVITKVCVGNKSNQKMKIQITMKETNLKYSIESIPNIIIINKGEACEFELKLKMLCTCKVKDKIMIVTKPKHKKKEIIKSISFEAESEISTRIGPDEISEEKKLGEGSFGIVYLGNFRGNKVAIKKMKQLNEEALDEFEKEVTMLDKFRSEYIIHFYGAVFIPNKICMVTEFAQFGSLQDLKNKRKEDPISMKIRIKMMIDSAKGIQYLHSNGILHRDIKPDNILVVSLENNISVNAKLTDFGSSRNVNMMMTNMTFTKGIGSPSFMSPEVLKKQKYKMPSDVYSFAITMFEIFGWCEAYPKSLFNFRWDIADFVSAGERRQKPDNMTDDQYQLISGCWKQDSKQRITIGDVVEELRQLKKKLKTN